LIPVLLVAFNRPEETEATLRALAQAPISQLYIALDGPRPGNVFDEANCARVLQLVKSTEVGAPVHVRSRSSNLGCKNSMVDAATWFFQNVEMGAIIEDDCVPSTDFFRWMEHALMEYRGSPNVLSIAGNLMVDSWRNKTEAFHFSKYPNVWGWGTWASVWRDYDPEIVAWKKLKNSRWLREEVGLDFWAERFWFERFEQVARGEIDTWDYQLTFMAFLHNKVTVVPHFNTVLNIGFGPLATHTNGPPPEWLAKTLDEKIPRKFPKMRGPSPIDSAADLELERLNFRTKRPAREIFGIFLKLHFRRNRTRLGACVRILKMLLSRNSSEGKR
jgi:hypothetical protein